MKSFTSIALYLALAARQVAGHATFQQLWVGGKDLISPIFPVQFMTFNYILC